jgi:hypothetical protein
MIIGIALFMSFMVGFAQAYAEKPLGNCRKLEDSFVSPNGTRYQPYNCNGDIEYIVN